MNQNESSLEDDVSNAFTRAYNEQDYEVAEHLLRALEIMAEREGDGGKTEKRIRAARAALRLVWPLPDH